MEFITDYNTILNKIKELDPLEYAKTRNYINGSVSYLSPYISRGVISVKQIQQQIISQGCKLETAEKFLQELAWREYYQRIWREKKELIWDDMGRSQPDVAGYEMITSVLEAKTGITAIDEGINMLYQTGYMHNHVRMYVASIVCNIGKSHWKSPATWLYYHLLDGDVASNNASWQWVSGTFSYKKYYCNQENINKYTLGNQCGTFLDKSYEELPITSTPLILKDQTCLLLKTVLPQTTIPSIDASKPTLIYNSYNLDPIWRKDDDANRILLLEPSHFSKHPVSNNVLDFIISLSKNIHGIQVFTGELSDLTSLYTGSNLSPGEIFISKDHPAYGYYTGKKDDYEWMFPEVQGAYSSFFKYWKICRPFLEEVMNQHTIE